MWHRRCLNWLYRLWSLILILKIEKKLETPKNVLAVVSIIRKVLADVLVVNFDFYYYSRFIKSYSFFAYSGAIGSVLFRLQIDV